MATIDPVAKAKEIAARLNGGGDSSSTTSALDVAKAADAALATATSTSPGTKRKRWGVTPDSVVEATTPTAAPATKKTKTDDSSTPPAATKRMWVNLKLKPASHYKAFLCGLESDLESKLKPLGITFQLKGRGSGRENGIPGVPEEPMHILLGAAASDTFAMAEPLVDEYLRQAEQAETIVVEEEGSGGAGGAKSASTENALATTSTYRPATVASLLQGGGGGNNGDAGYYGNQPAEMLEEQIGVPNGVVGFIIGRGGETIASMQARTGCKVQIQKEHEMKPEQNGMRYITLTASAKDRIDECRTLIQNMVQERVRTTNSSYQAPGLGSAGASSGNQGSGPMTQEQKLQEAVAAGHQLVKVQVPDTDVGLIIGKAGGTIKSIQDRSGASIQIPQTGDSENPSMRTVSITHPTMQGAEYAKQLIQELLATKKEQTPQLTLEVQIPDKDVGMCIGRGGCVIREMQNKTGTRIQIPSYSQGPYRTATVVGPSEGCHQVKQMIERIILEQSSQSVMSGAPPDYSGGGGYGGGGRQHQQQYGYGGHQGYGHQQQGYGGGGGGYGHQQQHGGQQKDYSAEWAAYYAAQGQQQGQQQQQQASASAATTGDQQQPQGAEAYYEQFHRYAYYYGEEAARKYYGAYSPPEGTPNPYGVNPNGTTAPPDASDGKQQQATTQSQQQEAATAPAPAAAAPAPAVRDTGRRGVSNLPAWMTKK